MNKLIFISYFTISTPYENEVKKLKDSFEKFKLHYYIYPVNNQGSWEKNCQYKANIIAKTFLNFPEHDIVYTDIDSVINKYPELFFTLDCDIAFHKLRSEQIFLSGTIFLKNNNNCKDFINYWIKVNDTNNELDQYNLKWAWLDYGKKFMSYEKLPAEYCKIFDIGRGAQDCSNDDSYIIHYQKSRDYKRVVNEKNNNDNNIN